MSYVHLDVTNIADWRAAVEATLAEFGSLTTLVNNAGIYTWHGLEETDDIEWSRMGVNLEGQWHGMRAAMPALTRAGVTRGASIANISSIYAVVGSIASTAYQPLLHQHTQRSVI